MLGNGFETYSEKQDFKKIEGITFLTLNELFYLLEEEKTKIEKNQLHKYNYSITISYLEVYNEKVRDLLRKDEISNLTILEDPELGVVIPGLKTCRVSKLSDAIALVNFGNQRRTMAATHSNEFSSRSHAIIQISLAKTINSGDRTFEVTSKLNMVDLAGSEKEHPGTTLGDQR